MVIRLPETIDAMRPHVEDLTPREIVAELDKYIVGQAAAKRAVAIAIRNRRRRLRLPEDLRDEVAPKNIIMIGPTGVGKTEISRRLSRLTGSPFLKVEATKFTEVGYVGRDVESMIRDIVELAITMINKEKAEEVRPKAQMQAEERLLDLLLPPPPQTQPVPSINEDTDLASRAEQRATREKLRAQLRDGTLDEHSDVQHRIAFRVDEHLNAFDLDILAADHCRQLWLRELHDSKRTPLRDDQPRDRRRIGVNRRKRGRTAPAAGQDRHECQDGAEN